MSETARARDRLAEFIKGPHILDVGFGGTACHPDAITLDMPKGYCPSIEGHRQILRGDARDLSFICDGRPSTGSWSSHLMGLTHLLGDYAAFVAQYGLAWSA